MDKDISGDSGGNCACWESIMVQATSTLRKISSNVTTLDITQHWYTSNQGLVQRSAGQWKLVCSGFKVFKQGHRRNVRSARKTLTAFENKVKWSWPVVNTFHKRFKVDSLWLIPPRRGFTPIYTPVSFQSIQSIVYSLAASLQALTLLLSILSLHHHSPNIPNLSEPPILLTQLHHYTLLSNLLPIPETPIHTKLAHSLTHPRYHRTIKRNLTPIGLVEIKHCPRNHIRRIRKLLLRKCDTIERLREFGYASVDLKVVDDYSQLEL